MRRARFVLPLFLVLLMVMACATFKMNTYKSLYSSGVAYDTAMQIVADLDGQGKITPEQKAEIVKMANVYYVAYHAAVDAFETYIKTDAVEDKDKLAEALADVAGKLGKIVDYVSRLKGGV